MMMIDGYRTKCRHVFSRAAIFMVLNQHVHVREDQSPPPPGHAPCPTAGCEAILGPSDLVADTNLAKRVETHVRRSKTEAATQRSGTQYKVLSDSDSD